MGEPGKWDNLMTEAEVHKVMHLAYDLSAVEMTVLFYYNTDPADIIKMLFPDADLTYVSQKIEVYHKGFEHFWGILDWDHRARFIEAAKKHYAEEAQKSVQAYIMTLK